MKRVLFYLSLVAVVVMSSCSKEDPVLVNEPSTDTEVLEPLSGEEINKIVRGIVEQKGEFSWNDADDYVLWSALMHGDSILTVGYGKGSFSTQKSTERANTVNDLLSLAASTEGGLKSSESILIDEEEIINTFDIKVGSIETVTTLRSNPNVRYVDPEGYNYFAYEARLKSASGCSNDWLTINSSDYTTVSPGCKASWTYYKHNITSAWNYSTGSGITVGLIDTGVSDGQSMLGSYFNDGYSSGRFIQKYGVFVDSKWPWKTNTDGVHDKCGHGTRMAGTIASPRNNNNLPVGVAYNCNLVSYRATGDVVLNGYHEKRGVARALTEMGNRSDVKVISMSIGHIISSGKIEDGIKYAYSRGKLIIAAGGTSTFFTNWTGVIFPASMSETVAVTGITDASGFNECSDCHYGSKIDFAVIMERSSNSNRKSVGLGYYNNQTTYTGGSSVSTATTAGIAALIWARHPTWTRSQVLTKMKQSASYYPNKHSDFGYGTINALLAVQ